MERLPPSRSDTSPPVTVLFNGLDEHTYQLTYGVPPPPPGEAGNVKIKEIAKNSSDIQPPSSQPSEIGKSLSPLINHSQDLAEAPA